MANLYSATLWRVINNAVTDENVLSDPVPEGYVYLIRRISIWNPNLFEIPLSGLTIGAIVQDDAPDYYAQFVGTILQAGNLYEQETRRVLEAGRQLYAYPIDAGWSWEVTGWKLLSP